MVIATTRELIVVLLVILLDETEGTASWNISVFFLFKFFGKVLHQFYSGLASPA